MEGVSIFMKKLKNFLQT